MKLVLVSMPSSISLPVNLISLVVASIRIHSRIFIVVLVGTAFITCEKSKFNIAGKSGDDFSYLPAIIKDKMITLSQLT